MESVTDATIDSLLAVNINSLNKPDLVTKSKQLQDVLQKLIDEKKESNSVDQNLQVVLQRLTALELKESNNANEIVALQNENRKMKKRIQELENLQDDVDSRLIDAEKSVLSVEQYTRRENFEISGIPTNIPHEELKDRVISIANSVCEPTVPIVAKDIHACHRLKEEDGKAAVIVRMVNRENTVSILKSKKKLVEKSRELGYQEQLYVGENLCTGTKEIFAEARKLKKNKLISSCWTYNGVVHIKKRETDRRGKKIFHFVDFEDHFTRSQLGWD